MATIRALSGDWSLSQGFRRYFSCCFASSRSKDGSRAGDDAVKLSVDSDLDDKGALKEKALNGDTALRASYGSLHSAKSLGSSRRPGKLPRTEGDGAEIMDAATDPDLAAGPTQERQEVVHIVNGDGQQGTSYAYDDQETSSDSDDEVLRHYQQSIQRAPSQHSVHSTRSQKSSASKVSKSNPRPTASPQHDDTSPTDPDGNHTTSFITSGDERTDAGRPESVRSGSTSHRTAASVHAPEPAPEGAPQATYANSGYVKDADVTSPQHVSPTSTEQALSAYGEGSGSTGDEHLFDVSDLQDREPVLISKCGNLEVTFEYDPDQTRINITIHRALEIPSKDRGGANNTQVRTLLLPTKKLKHKTKVKQGENPEFMEMFHFKIPPEDVANMGVRFRLYGCERMRRERMIGEVIIGFASLSLDTPTTHMLTLEPRSNLSHGDSKLDVSSLSRSDSASSTQSMQHGGMPELLVGLTYNGTTGRLSVEVIKGSNFKNMAMNRAPDTYVKLTLMSPNGQEIARSKTSIRRGQPNPLYKETFMFQVALFQLPDVTLMISVYNKKSMKRKEMIGWFSLGYSSSGEEEISHWNDMRDSKGEPVCRWHVLLEA